MGPAAAALLHTVVHTVVHHHRRHHHRVPVRLPQQGPTFLLHLCIPISFTKSHPATTPLPFLIPMFRRISLRTRMITLLLILRHLIPMVTASFFFSLFYCLLSFFLVFLFLPFSSFLFSSF